MWSAAKSKLDFVTKLPQADCLFLSYGSKMPLTIFELMLVKLTSTLTSYMMPPTLALFTKYKILAWLLGLYSCIASFMDP